MTWAVEWRGSRIAGVKTAWGKIVEDAKPGWDPTQHTLEHTATTWAVQGGATIEDTPGFLSTSADTIDRTYWHLSPHFQSVAVSAMENGGRREKPIHGQNVGETKVVVRLSD